MTIPETSTIVVMAGAATTAGSMFKVLAPIGSSDPTRVELVICAARAIATANPSIGNPMLVGISVYK